MKTRRALFVLMAGLALVATPAAAQSWKEKYPELVMALVPSENATGVLARVGPFAQRPVDVAEVREAGAAVEEPVQGADLPVGQRGAGRFRPGGCGR